MLKHTFKESGRDPKELKVFSLADQENSLPYSPLSNGRALELKDRLMGAFTWSEPYYQSMSSQFLTSVLIVLKTLTITPTLFRLKALCEDSHARNELKKKVYDATGQGKSSRKNLNEELNSAFKIDLRALSGLASQLGALSNSCQTLVFLIRSSN